ENTGGYNSGEHGETSRSLKTTTLTTFNFKEHTFPPPSRTDRSDRENTGGYNSGEHGETSRSLKTTTLTTFNFKEHTFPPPSRTD
nr:hypothetical protein [Tanacetum cinerariifolium]